MCVDDISFYSLQTEDDVMKEDERNDPNNPQAILAKGAAVDDEYGSRKGSDTTYYSIAHTLRETITEQPSIIAFGQLKEYQVGVVLRGTGQGGHGL